MVEMVYYNKQGRKSKKPPKGVPECKPDLEIKGGVTPANGVPVKPLLDSEMRKRAKKKRV